MNKKVRWGLIAFIAIGLAGWGIYSQLPKTNEDLKAADEVSGKDAKEKQILNVNAKIIKPESLTDEIKISGRLLPDEEVDLTFETSRKVRLLKRDSFWQKSTTASCRLSWNVCRLR